MVVLATKTGIVATTETETARIELLDVVDERRTPLIVTHEPVKTGTEMTGTVSGVVRRRTDPVETAIKSQGRHRPGRIRTRIRLAQVLEEDHLSANRIVMAQQPLLAILVRARLRKTRTNDGDKMTT